MRNLGLKFDDVAHYGSIICQATTPESVDVELVITNDAPAERAETRVTPSTLLSCPVKKIRELLVTVELVTVQTPETSVQTP